MPRALLHHVTAGPADGAAVLFLHAFPLHSGMWARQMEAVAGAGHRAMACDLRGLGRTPVDGAPFLLEHHVDDVLAVLDAARVERAVVCGLSMGGYVALRLAERARARVAALVLCDTRAEADGDAAKVKRAAAMDLLAERGVDAFAPGFVADALGATTRARDADLVRRVVAMIGESTAEGMRAALAALAARTDTTGALAGLAGLPACVVVGEEDTLTPPAVARGLAQALGGAELHVLAGAGHFSNLERPDAFDEALLAFLARVTRRSSG